MNRNRTLHVALVAVLALHVAAASADVVTLVDGSRMVGVIESLAGGKLLLKTEYAGTIELDAAQLATIETESTVNVALTSGDQLVGRIEWSEADNHPIVQTGVGPVPITVDRIAAIWPEEGKSPEVLAMEEQLTKAEADFEAQKAKWSAIFEAGLFFTEGNSNVFRVHGRAEAIRKSAKDLLKFYVSAEYSEEDDVRSTSEVKGGGYYEYLFTERFFGFGRFDLEYDEFENLDLRASFGVGAGYYWIKKEDHELKTRAGIGYLHESYMDGTSRDTAQAEVGLDYRIDITPWLRFTSGNTWYPTFKSIRDYRLVSDNAFLIPLGDSDIWKLKLGALYEYDSIPNPGFERLDQTYMASIVLELK